MTTLNQQSQRQIREQQSLQTRNQLLVAKMTKMTQYKGQYWREDQQQSVMDSLSLRESQISQQVYTQQELDILKKVRIDVINTQVKKADKESQVQWWQVTSCNNKHSQTDLQLGNEKLFTNKEELSRMIEDYRLTVRVQQYVISDEESTVAELLRSAQHTADNSNLAIVRQYNNSMNKEQLYDDLFVKETRIHVLEADYASIVADFQTVKEGALKTLEFYRKQWVKNLEDLEKIKLLGKEIIGKEKEIQRQSWEIERVEQEMIEKDQQLETFMSQIEEQQGVMIGLKQTEKLYKDIMRDKKKQEKQLLRKSNKEKVKLMPNKVKHIVNKKKGGLQIKKKAEQQNDPLQFSDENQNIVDQILPKVRSQNFQGFENLMEEKKVLQMINYVYNARKRLYEGRLDFKEIEERSGSLVNYDFANFTFTYMQDMQQQKDDIDKKFIIFMISLKKYYHFFRVNMFCRMVGILDNYLNYSVDEQNKYVEALYFIENVSNIKIHQNITETAHQKLVPYLKALQYVNHITDNKMMTSQQQNSFKKNLERLRNQKPTQSLNSPKSSNINSPSLPTTTNSANLIDFDCLMQVVLENYKQIIKLAKMQVINAFDASDLDGNKMCNLDEFLLLNRHLEPDNYDEEALTTLFMAFADVEDNDGELNLSFDKFSVVSYENQLFSNEVQNIYLEIKTEAEVDSKYIQLQAEWPEKLITIKELIELTTNLTIEEEKKWLEISQQLDTSIRSNEVMNKKALLIGAKILHLEIQMLFDAQNEDENQSGTEIGNLSKDEDDL